MHNTTKTDSEKYSAYHSSPSYSSICWSTDKSNEDQFCREIDLQSSSGCFGFRNDAQPTKNDCFFEMLHDYKPAVLGVIGTNQRSPGPSEFMQDSTDCSSQNTQYNLNRKTDSNSSKVKIEVKNKLHKFLVPPKPKIEDISQLGLSLLTKNWSINEYDTKRQHCISSTKRKFFSVEEIEEHQRQRTFAHYDCQSMAANMIFANRIKQTTSTNNESFATIEKPCCSVLHEPNNLFVDHNYGSELLKSCLHFSNEIGGVKNGQFCHQLSAKLKHRFVSLSSCKSIIPCSVSILESLPNETLWAVGACPFQNDSWPIESLDHGAHYYKKYFYNQKHENWFGIDENLGPIGISIKKESSSDKGSDGRHQTRQRFRLIIRTSQLLTLRGLVIEDSIINSRVSVKSVNSKELLEYVAPYIQLNCLRLGANTPNCEQQLLKLDEQGLQSKYKVGILYCRRGQWSEEDMYNNEHAGPAFTEFLDAIGKRVRLKNFQHYKAGLDNKSDSTGTHSIFAFYKQCEIMFHVCTMLPFTPNNRQQLLRKRHIGNDIVTIIFQEPGALPFDPNNIRSQFQHVFLVVKAVNPCSSNTTYRMAITRSKEVPMFGPPLPPSGLFSRNKTFTEFILAKTINAENAAHRSEKFSNLAIRTRREYLKDLSINYCTNISIDPVNKFSIFSNKKKEKMEIQFFGDIFQRGAICWRIMLQHTLVAASECLLGISIDTLVIIEESSKTVIFAIPTRSILGWSTCYNSFRIFYHNGECINWNMRCFGGIDEQIQVIYRLRAVTLGNGALVLNITTKIMGQLDFHVQPDGVITQVDATGYAWAAGLRRGYRLVEVCKTVVATLSYVELIDLLKTSSQINVVVIKSISDGSPRLGCFNKNCKINLLSQKFDNTSSKKNILEKNGYSRKSLLPKEAEHHATLKYKNNVPYEEASLSSKSDIITGQKTDSESFSSKSLDDELNKKNRKSNVGSPHLLKNKKCYATLEDPVNHNYFFKSLQTSSKLEMSLNHTKALLPSTDRSKLLLTESRKLQQRSPQYEVIGLKCVNIPPVKNNTTDPNDFDKTHSNSTENNNAIESKISLKNKNTSLEQTAVFPYTVATANFDQIFHSFNPTVKRIQEEIGITSTFNQFSTDLIGMQSTEFFSGSESEIISTSKRHANPKMVDEIVSLSTTNNYIHAEKHRSFENSIRSNMKTGQQILIASSSSTRLKEISQFHHKKTMSTTPPLVVPNSKELDWTTLVGTATKAIINHQQSGQG